MEYPLFFAPPENLADGLIHLPAAEARHAVTVMRLKPPALVIVVDGLGTAYRGELVSATRRKVMIRVHSEQRNFGEPTVRVTLAAGLSTGGKFDTVVQNGTELGVKRFVPIVAEKSKVRLDDPKRARARVNRLERVALAAIKQCHRAYRPEIALPTTLIDFLREQDNVSLKLMFHQSAEAQPIETVDMDKTTKRVTLLIGPESGFSNEEACLAVEAGFIPISLGQRILRTETAGPAAVALVMQRLGEFR